MHISLWCSAQTLDKRAKFHDYPSVYFVLQRISFLASSHCMCTLMCFIYHRQASIRFDTVALQVIQHYFDDELFQAKLVNLQQLLCGSPNNHIVAKVFANIYQSCLPAKWKLRITFRSATKYKTPDGISCKPRNTTNRQEEKECRNKASKEHTSSVCLVRRASQVPEQ